MLKDFNDIRISGRLGGEVELHQPQGSKGGNGMSSSNNDNVNGNGGNVGNGKSSGGEVRATFRLANSRSVRDPSTETGWRREPNWINVVAWGPTAESLAKYAAKGDQVWLVGWLQNREYTDKNGQRQKISEVIVDDYGIIEKVRSNDGGESSEKEKEVMSAVES